MYRLKQQERPRGVPKGAQCTGRRITGGRLKVPAVSRYLYRIAKSTCDIAGPFRRPPVIRRLVHCAHFGTPLGDPVVLGH